MAGPLKLDGVPAELRARYLDSLPEPQEMFVENLVANGTVWQLSDGGYAVVNGTSLVGFFTPSNSDTVELLAQVMRASGAVQVMCKSFDRQLLDAALPHSRGVRTTGLLFRRIAQDGYSPRPDCAIRPGDDDDAEAIMAFDDGFFDGADEVRKFAAINGLFVLKSHDAIVGCGVAKRVIPGRPAVDIGMLVAPAHRRGGYGAHIIAFLKDHTLRSGLRPICGCAFDNIGSQRTLHNAGFRSDHALLRIDYRQ